MFTSRLIRLHLKRRYRGYSQSPAFKNDVLEKIIYNSELQRKKVVQHWHNLKVKYTKQKQVEMRCDVAPVTLQYLDEYSAQNETILEPKVINEPKEKPHILPYSIVNKVTNFDKDNEKLKDFENNEVYNDCKSRCGRVSVLTVFLIWCCIFR